VSGRSVRDATLDVLRRRGLTTLFSNPGSTEVPFLAGLPDDIRFVLALHEGSVVGLATGWAIGKGEPGFVVLHTVAGLGNAVGALATARLNRAPLVVVVGQQDRRHLALEPFTSGRLAGLAGDYPVWVNEPVRPQDVPGAISRAYHEAITGRGPALVIVPMDDWNAPAADEPEAAPVRMIRGAGSDPDAVAALTELLARASNPALVVGALADDAATWAALATLAERRALPVFQESFGARAGFPQDHPRFAGHLPADRKRLRDVLAAHDVVLVVGGSALRQYPYADGRLVAEGTTVAVLTDDPSEAHRSVADLAVLAKPAAICAELARMLPAVAAPPPQSSRPAAPEPPKAGQPLRAAHVLSALAERLSPDTVVVEETPSSRPELHQRLPARAPLGFVSAAMGGLGFALPAAAGLKLALPDRPVVAVVGDGSSLYSIQALWSAVRYEAGAVFVILVNGGYAVMDRLAEQVGREAPWPSFHDVDVATIAEGFACPVRRISEHDELLRAFDEVIPSAAGRREPILLAIDVAPDEIFAP
jgi:benzoylformate decarboxylase